MPQVFFSRILLRFFDHEKIIRKIVSPWHFLIKKIILIEIKKHAQHYKRAVLNMNGFLNVLLNKSMSLTLLTQEILTVARAAHMSKASELQVIFSRIIPEVNSTVISESFQWNTEWEYQWLQRWPKKKHDGNEKKGTRAWG